MLIPLLMAGLAAAGRAARLLALAAARPMDAVQARLSQLGSMQARTLEEIELQQPLFERTLRPLATRLSGLAQRFASPQKVSRTEKRLAMAGNPGDLRTVDFLGLKFVVADAARNVDRSSSWESVYGQPGLRYHGRLRPGRPGLHGARIMAQPAHARPSARDPARLYPTPSIC